MSAHTVATLRLGSLSLSNPPLPPPPRLGEPHPSILLHEVAAPLLINPQEHGIATENVTTARILRQILERNISHIQPLSGSRFTISDVKRVRFDIQPTPHELEACYENRTPVRYVEATHVVGLDGQEAFHEQGEAKRQKGIQYMTWERKGMLFAAVPIVCTATVEQEGVERVVSLLHHYYTGIAVPIEPASDYDRLNFKNRLAIVLIKIREKFSQLETFKDESYRVGCGSSINMAMVPFEHSLSRRGFTRKENEAFWGSKHTYTEEYYSRFDETEYFGQKNPDATLDCILKPEYRERYIQGHPDHPHELPVDFITLPLAFGGSLDGRSLEEIQRLSDAFRESCASYCRESNPAIAQQIPSMIAALTPEELPPEFDRRYFPLYKELKRAHGLLVDLQWLMKETFEEAVVKRETRETVYRFCHDDLQQYDEQRAILSVLSAYHEFQRHKIAFCQKEKELVEMQKRVSDAQASGTPIDPLLPPQMEQKRGELEALQRAKGEIEERTHATKRDLRERIRRIYVTLPSIPSDTTHLPPSYEKLHCVTPAFSKMFISLPMYRGEEKTVRRIGTCTRKMNFHRSMLSDKVLVMQQKYEEIQKARAVCQTLVMLFPFAQSDRQVRILGNSLLDALRIYKFDEMGQAIVALEGMVRQRPLVLRPGLTDDFFARPVWTLPPAPRYPF